MPNMRERNAKALTGGRVEQEGYILGGRSAYFWRCTCRPEDGHDHAAVQVELAAGLEERDGRLDGLNALVGTNARVGLLRFTVTDCNIQIQGPEKWTLYVAWEEAPVDGESQRREWQTVMVRPELCQTPEAVLEAVRSQVEENGRRYAAAVRAAGEFNSGG